MVGEVLGRNKTKVVWFHFTEATKPLNGSKSIQVSPCGVRWKSTVGQLQMSSCLQKWSSLHFSHPVCGLFYTTAQHVSCDLLSLMNVYFQNQFQYIFKYSYCTECPVNLTWCFLQPCCYYNLYLHPPSIKIWLNNVLYFHTYISVIPVWNKLNTARFSLLVEIIV